jgi:hypothetical protein
LLDLKALPDRIVASIDELNRVVLIDWSTIRTTERPSTAILIFLARVA